MTTEQFKRDLERGHAGERFLAAQYPPDSIGGQIHPPYLREPPDGERRWDLEEHSQYGGRLKTIEVKTDSYDPEATPNFFMELLTSTNGWEGVGGPWRARADKVDTFVYLYHREGREPSRAFWFYDLPALCRELDTQPSRFQMRSVKLDRLRATGLLVPRTVLAHLYTEVVYGG